jgi:hypothetical protein
VSTALELAGAALVVAGATFLALWFGLIVAGALLIFWAEFGDH